jgi:hypothetical protein
MNNKVPPDVDAHLRALIAPKVELLTREEVKQIERNSHKAFCDFHGLPWQE